MKNILSMIILWLNLMSCSFFKTKDEGLRDELCRNYQVKNDSLLVYKNYYYEDVPIVEIYNKDKLSNLIPPRNIIFIAGTIGDTFSLRDKATDELLYQLKSQELVKNNDKVGIGKVLVKLREFSTYLIYASNKNKFLRNKRLYLLNYKNEKILSWINVSRLIDRDIDDVYLGDLEKEPYILDSTTELVYSKLNDDNIWKIQKDRYSSCNHKLFKKQEYAHFKINDSGYVEVLK